MKKMQKLLCMVLALVMALSLCTVAMAEETKGPYELTDVEFTLGDDYAYGKSVGEAIGSATTGSLSYNNTVNGYLNSGAFVLDYSRCGICTKNGDLYTELASSNTLMDHTNYYLKLVFVLYHNMTAVNDGYKLPADFTDLQQVSEVVKLTYNGSSCNPVKVNPAYNVAGANQNDIHDECTVYFALPQLTAKTTTVTIPFTKVVELGGNKAPGSKTFNVEQVDEKFPDVTVTGSVTVNGKGTFNGTITVSGPENTVKQFIQAGFVVKEVNDNAKNWTKYDDTAWFVKQQDSPVVNSVESGDTAMSGVAFDFFKGKFEDGNFVADGNEVYTTMTFTNTYTENTSTPTVKPSKPATTVVEAPKTFDGGVALYAALSVLSMTGAVVVGKKRDK